MQFVVHSHEICAVLDEFKRLDINAPLRVELRDGIVILDGVSGGRRDCGSGCDAAERHLRIRIGAFKSWGNGAFICAQGDLHSDLPALCVTYDAFGLSVNGRDGLFAENCDGVTRSWEPGADALFDGAYKRYIGTPDCQEIAWAMHAADDIDNKIFSRICLRGDVVEATECHMLMRGMLSSSGGFMLIPKDMADVASRHTGDLRFASTPCGIEWARFASDDGFLTYTTARPQCDRAWPDFSKAIPVGLPECSIHVPHLLERIRGAMESIDALDGEKTCYIRLSCPKNERKLRVEAIEMIRPMKPPFDRLERSGNVALRYAMLDDPSGVDALASFGIMVNAKFLLPILDGFPERARLSIQDSKGPLVFDDGAHLALVMPIEF